MFRTTPLSLIALAALGAAAAAPQVPAVIPPTVAQSPARRDEPGEDQ